jgi:hypothetical protein
MLRSEQEIRRSIDTILELMALKPGEDLPLALLPEDFEGADDADVPQDSFEERNARRNGRLRGMLTALEWVLGEPGQPP